MAVHLNDALDPAAVPPPSGAARVFHEARGDYAPTPAVPLPALADELGLEAVVAKDESDRLGLPAFKGLGASWAVERALAAEPGTKTKTLVAASAGNHGRAVARMAAERGLAARVFVPERSLEVRRRAIASEGAELVVITGPYEDAVVAAGEAAEAPGTLEIADVGSSRPAHDVIDGYATLFTELAAQAAVDVVLVPIGVGSLGAAAARFGAAQGVTVVGVEPAVAACLTASLAAGEPTPIDTPGTVMAGMDCAEVSEAAWPSLRSGIAATVTVDDAELETGFGDLKAAGIDAGECSASTAAALRQLGASFGDGVALIATEGPTARDPLFNAS